MGNVTLSAAEAGAAIYYTTDGTFPGAGNAGGRAALYTGPFHVASGTVVRWAGYLTGCYGSDAGQAVVS